MILPDVNILVYAFRRDGVRHAQYAHWLDELVNGADELALNDTVLSGFVRVVTNRRILAEPSAPAAALSFVATLRRAARARWTPAGHQTWEALGRLSADDAGLRGDKVPDAYLAAVALTHGCRLATADRGFARYPGLRFFDPAA